MDRRKIPMKSKAEMQEPIISLMPSGILNDKTGGGAVIHVKMEVITVKYRISQKISVGGNPRISTVPKARKTFPTTASKSAPHAMR